MMRSFRSLKKSVVNITNSSTNKAFQVLVDPSRLQSPFNSRDKLFALCHVSASKIRVNVPSFELVDLVEPHNLSFIVVDLEYDGSRRLNDGIIMLELVAYSILSWFSELDSSRKHLFVRTMKMIEMTLQKKQIQVFKVTGMHVLKIFFSNPVFLEISSSEDNFAQVDIPVS
nr:hypothetical protein [Tanacetum cinerariifolium]